MRGRKPGGFILLDSLIAMGLLALAMALAVYPLVSAKQAWRNAVTSQFAAHLALNAINRVRMNAANTGGDYANDAIWEGTATGLCDQTCTSSQLVVRDAAELHEEWTQHHPDAAIRITRCNGALCLLLWWDSDHISGNDCTGESCLRVRFVP